MSQTLLKLVLFSFHTRIEKFEGKMLQLETARSSQNLPCLLLIFPSEYRPQLLVHVQLHEE